MGTLSDFISNRLAELAAEEKPLQAKLRAIVAEREQLNRAAHAAGIALPHAERPALSDLAMLFSDTHAQRPKVSSEKTIKEYVLSILHVEGRGMTALEILAGIKNRYGLDYPRTSLSPQLSRLKADGKITRDGVVWSLTKEADRPRLSFPFASRDPNQNAPQAEPGGASKSEPSDHTVSASMTEKGE